jgi:hypothetical protein
VDEAKANKSKGKHRVDIYIGSDNNTRNINESYLNKVRKWANKTFPDGYTLIKGKGYYNGFSEDSLLLHAFLDHYPVLKGQLKKLKRELRQESILVVKSAVDFELV